jgi:multidrug efflux system membrane fusion protein
MVPTASVQHGQKGLYVYVVDDQNRAAMRPITVSHEDTVNSVVTQGVKEGDRVITVGQFLLQPGTPVAIDAAATGS